MSERIRAFLPAAGFSAEAGNTSLREDAITTDSLLYSGGVFIGGRF
ncbi:MAG TPA: hypothetical protein VFC25_07085 [Verrucomicrobiae bacterium]|nr:hypothetical protein [Verrucomicrobiae bacterium]